MCRNKQTAVKFTAIYSIVQSSASIATGVVALLLHECILYADRRADPVGSFVFNFFYQYFYDKRKCLSKGHSWATIETYPGGKVTKPFQVQGWFIGYVANNTLWLTASLLLLIGYRLRSAAIYKIFIVSSTITVVYDLVLVSVFALDIKTEMELIQSGIESTGREFLTNTIIMTVFFARFVLFLVVNIYCMIAVYSAAKVIKSQNRSNHKAMQEQDKKHSQVNPGSLKMVPRNGSVQIPVQQMMDYTSIASGSNPLTKNRQYKSIPNLPVLLNEPRNLERTVERTVTQPSNALRLGRSYDSLSVQCRTKPATDLLQYDYEPRRANRNMFSYTQPNGVKQFSRPEASKNKGNYSKDSDETGTASESTSTYPVSVSDEDGVLYANVRHSVPRSDQHMYENLPLLRPSASKSSLKKTFSARKKLKSVSFSKIPTNSKKVGASAALRPESDTTGSGDEDCTNEFLIFNYSNSFSKNQPVYENVSTLKKNSASSPDLVFDPLSEKVKLVFRPSVKRKPYHADETAF